MGYALDRFAAEIRAALMGLSTPKAGIVGDLAFPIFRAAREHGAPSPALMATARALANGLRLLGIAAPERM